MKNQILLATTLAVVSLTSSHAGITDVSSGYSLGTYYTSSDSSDNIVSYDWDASNNLYYANSNSGTFDGLNEVSGGNTNNVVAGTSDYSGASVVVIGNYVYYNTTNSSTFASNIYKYGPINGSPASVLTSTTPNFGLYKQNGQLFITGSATFTNHIYHASLNADGSLNPDPATDLGEDSGSSGPLAFDAAGNLYYAPGYGDLSVYKWSAAAVAAALADPTTNPLSLANGTKWLDYSGSTAYNGFSGGTSMVIDGNQLLLTLTNFDAPSVLASFGIASTGSYDGTASTILDSDDTLGELRENDGGIFLSDDNFIYELGFVPEPSTVALSVFGGVLLLALGRRLRVSGTVMRRVLGIALLLPLFSSIASAVSVPVTMPVSASDPDIQGWATGVVKFLPGPVDIQTDPMGAKASYGTSASALGPSDAANATYLPNSPTPVVSLGDGGTITLSFAKPIANGPGADLAVFENGFLVSANNYYLELAKVAVSSDGINFFTFPSISLTQTNTQISSFGTMDPGNLYNLAGSTVAGFGTPFNLDDLAGVSPLLNINDITEVRVTDVIGNINSANGPVTYDDAANPIFNGAYGTVDHIINDPFPTNFSTGGFDLDAIAELNLAPEPQTWALFILGGLAVIFNAVRSRKISRS